MQEVAAWTVPEICQADAKKIEGFVEEISDAVLRQEVFFLEAVRMLAGPLAKAAEFLQAQTTRDGRRPSASSSKLVQELRSSMHMFSTHVQSLVFRCVCVSAFRVSAFRVSSGR